MIIFLLSDCFIWLFFGFICSIMLIYKQSRLSFLWKKKKIPIIFLLLWLVVVLLDSIHWQTSKQVMSVLDFLFNPEKLGQIGSEKGYYAPFSEHSYKQIQTLNQGKWTRGFIPSEYFHLLGTDKIGTDVFWACCKSFRTAFLLSFLSIFWTLLFAIPCGMISGWFPKWDKSIQYVANVINGIPAILLIALMAVIMDISLSQSTWLNTLSGEQKSDVKLWGFCFILGATSWTGYMRLIRQKTIELKNQDFMVIQQSFKFSHAYLLLKHVLPHIHIFLLSLVVFDVSEWILSEALLTYLGLGLDGNLMSFGNLLLNSQQELMQEPPILWVFGSVTFFLLLITWSVHQVADFLREK